MWPVKIIYNVILCVKFMLSKFNIIVLYMYVIVHAFVSTVSEIYTCAEIWTSHCSKY